MTAFAAAGAEQRQDHLAASGSSQCGDNEIDATLAAADRAIAEL
jgi:hypothetical protein